jgi:hypothetical protein
VTITGDIGIPLGGSTDYDVELSSDSGGGPVSAIRGARVLSVSGAEPIQLKIVTTPGGGTATFADGTTTTTITSSQTVTVQGVTPSSQAGDVQLVAVPAADPGVLLAEVQASAVSVTISLKSSGPPASDDGKGTTFLQGAKALGPGVDTEPPVPGASKSCAVGVELVGAVTPSDYTGTVSLRRSIVNGAYYQGSTACCGSPATPGDDTSFAAMMDSDPQSGGSAGKVYDLDAPGIAAPFSIPQGQSAILRYRTNFVEYAVLGAASHELGAKSSTKKASTKDFPFWVAVSCTWDASGDNQVLATDLSGNGDNSAGTGTTNTTWNLK